MTICIIKKDFVIVDVGSFGTAIAMVFKKRYPYFEIAFFDVVVQYENRLVREGYKDIE